MPCQTCHQVAFGHHEVAGCLQCNGALSVASPGSHPWQVPLHVSQQLIAAVRAESVLQRGMHKFQQCRLISSPFHISLPEPSLLHSKQTCRMPCRVLRLRIVAYVALPGSSVTAKHLVLCACCCPQDDRQSQSHVLMS